MRGWPVLEFSHYYLCWPTSSPPCRGMPPVAGGRQERHTSVRLKPYQEEQNRKSRPFCGILMWFCCTPSIEPWRGWGDMAEGSWMKNCCGDESMQGVSSAVVSCPENPFIIFTSLCHCLLWQWERLCNDDTNDWWGAIGGWMVKPDVDSEAGRRRGKVSSVHWRLWWYPLHIYIRCFLGHLWGVYVVHTQILLLTL